MYNNYVVYNHLLNPTTYFWSQNNAQGSNNNLWKLINIFLIYIGRHTHSSSSLRSAVLLLSAAFLPSPFSFFFSLSFFFAPFSLPLPFLSPAGLPEAHEKKKESKKQPIPSPCICEYVRYGCKHTHMYILYHMQYIIYMYMLYDV